MARGTSLLLLVDKLKAEAGQSALVSAGVDALPALKQILRRTQETLYDDYAWPHMRFMPFKNLAAGQRYYDLPSGLNMERIEDVAVWHNGKPMPVERGIGFAEYASYDSDSDDRADPVLRWDIRSPSGTPQIEVWPLPATNASTGPSHNRLHFIGIRSLSALTADADTADLDDQMIVLFAAAEMLARQKSEDAPAKLAAAQSRYNRLKGRLAGGSGPVVLGGGATQRKSTGTTIVISG